MDRRRIVPIYFFVALGSSLPERREGVQIVPVVLPSGRRVLFWASYHRIRGTSDTLPDRAGSRRSLGNRGLSLSPGLGSGPRRRGARRRLERAVRPLGRMESGVLRLLLLLALFFLLTGDYTTLLGQLFGALGVSPSRPADDNNVDGTTTTGTTPSHDTLPANIDALDTLTSSARLQLVSTIKNACLPKLICELNASPHREKLTEKEKALLTLIRDTSISVTAEVTSKYHFAAHMGQLIAGVDGAGCHNFYPTCPFPGLHVLSLMKRVRF